MLNRREIEGSFRKIQVVRAPKRRLATFGTSRIEYQLITDVPGLPDRSRLRTGLVIAERPQIITPETARERFHGFGPDAGGLIEALLRHYGEALRGVEYHFRNEPSGGRVELQAPDVFVAELSRRHDADGGFHTAVIRGTEAVWQLALMKFIVEETLASFVSNFNEFRERGFFDTDDDRLKKKKTEIESLLAAAGRSKSAIPMLAAKLKEYGLFEMYQDEFFRVVNR